MTDSGPRAQKEAQPLPLARLEMWKTPVEVQLPWCFSDGEDLETLLSVVSLFFRMRTAASHAVGVVLPTMAIVVFGSGIESNIPER